MTLLAASGCSDPEDSEGIECNEQGRYPAGMECGADGRCRLPGRVCTTDIECDTGVCDTATGTCAAVTCDDGGPTAMCSATCMLPSCGDGVVDVGEDCDDGGESAVCNANCTVATCGDGIANASAGDACDDAGESATCNADCTVATCGDAYVNPAAGEACDDGNTIDNDDCTSFCTAATCGDGVVWNLGTGTEECDSGGVDTATCNVNCTFPVCGDSYINTAAGEDCDDGNADYGDGCNTTCLTEERCVITHNGGSPLTLSTVRISAAGAASVVETKTLTSNDNADSYDERQAITSCGTHVYAAERGSGAIAQLESQPDGTLSFVRDTNQANIFSVHCLPDYNTLIALSSPAGRTATLDMVSYSIDAVGDLSYVATQTLTFAPGTYDFRNIVPAAINPNTGELWLIGYFRNSFDFVSGPFRIRTTGNGAVQVAEGPVDIGGSDIGNQISFGNGGRQMVMAGLSGGCTGAWSLPMDGSVPASGDRLYDCAGNFANGRTSVSRSADKVFYQGHSGASVRIP